LAFTWTDDESQLRFDMFPELLAMDCTYHTNKERRPICLLSGIDGHNTTHTHTWIVLPSEVRWAFDWVLTKVMPQLHGNETLNRVKMICTDQDSQLVLSVTKKMTQASSWLKGVSYWLCAWHKLNRNLTELSKFQTSANQLNDTGCAEWQAIAGLLWQIV
jgi:hypothetical protein